MFFTTFRLTSFEKDNHSHFCSGQHSEIKKKKTPLNVKQRTKVLVQLLFYIDKNVSLILNLKVGGFSCNKDC